jgi:hypothetical protein
MDHHHFLVLALHIIYVVLYLSWYIIISIAYSIVFTSMYVLSSCGPGRLKFSTL